MIDVRDLDLMTYREKTLHWMRPDCWNPHGAQLRFRQPDCSIRVSTDRCGTVTNMSSLLVGRPCFGIITARVRYRDAMKSVKGRGLLPASRCADCKVRESCERLVKERIRSFAPLSIAYDEWLRAEGSTKFGNRDFEHTHVGRLWKCVGLAAADAPFQSSNDAEVANYYEKLDQDARDRDRLRQARNRERARLTGKLDNDHVADIEIAANHRLITILDAMFDTQAPRELRRLPIQSLEDLRDVWLGREILRAERKKCRAPDIARWIIAAGRRNDSSTFGALSTRVSKDLGRIERFERLIWNGSPLLKRFNLRQESWSQIAIELVGLNLLEKPHLVDELIPLGIAGLVQAELLKRTPQDFQKT